MSQTFEFTNRSEAAAFNQIFERRPLWAAVGLSAGPSVPLVSWLGAGSLTDPIMVDDAVGGRNRRRAATDEVSVTYYKSASTSYPSGSAPNPANGYWGIADVFNTGCADNYFINDDGNYGFYNSSQSLNTLISSGCIVGERDFRQYFNLCCHHANVPGSLALLRMGALDVEAAANADAGQNISLANYGIASPCRGGVSYNRRTGKLAIIEVSGTSKSTTLLDYKLHYFDLSSFLKVGAKTTSAALKAAMDAAYATRDDAVVAKRLYVAHSFKLTAPDAIYIETNQTSDNSPTRNARIVLCDDDSLWMGMPAATATVSTSQGAIWRLDNGGVPMALGGSITPSLLAGYAGNAIQAPSGGRYGLRHMNSDDHSYVALFQQHYQYLSGIIAYFLPTRSARATGVDVATPYALTSTDPSFGYGIAPSGKSGFILSDGNNSDGGAGVRVAPVNIPGDSKSPNLVTLTYRTAFGIFPTPNASTAYQAGFVCKVQPTYE